MLAPFNLLERLEARFDETIAALTGAGTGRLVSLVLELPQVPRRPPGLVGPGFSLWAPLRESLHAGFGIVAERTASGTDRLADLRRETLALDEDWRLYDPDETGFLPFSLLGFSADPLESEPIDSTWPAAGLPNALLWVPELGVVVRRNQAALALTAPRSSSRSKDRALAAALQASDKDGREHRLVVQAIRESLSGCCSALELATAPRVMRLHNAQHLWSTVRARVAPGVDIFDLADRLHPNPATNGSPRDSARDWLRRAEPQGRGWCTGAAGILEHRQETWPSSPPDGELWVLLRSAEISGDRARLRGGAGIVAGSEPLADWSEAGHKLAAMAAALRFA